MKLSDIKIGDVLIADNGFDCLENGQTVIVSQDEGGLFVPCKSGKHHLYGQLDGRGEIVGLTIKQEEKRK